MTNHGNMYGPDFTFLGIERCDLDIASTYADADVVIIGAPIDSGTSYRSGAKFGPQAIRGADYLPHDGKRPHLALRIDSLNAWGPNFAPERWDVPLSMGAPTMTTSASANVDGISKSHRGMPRNVKSGPYILPRLTMRQE